MEVLLMSNITNIRTKSVPVMVDDKIFNIRYTLNAFAELEEAYGSVDKALKQLEEGSFKGIRKLLWAGLIHENPTLTEVEVGNMIDLENLNDFAGALTRAMAAARVPETKDASIPNVVTQK